jgi:hypothetical protein
MEEYELRRAMLDCMTDTDIRSIIFGKKKEAKEVRVPGSASPLLVYLAKHYSMDYEFVHNAFLEVLREPQKIVLDTMEQELKRRTYT